MPSEHVLILGGDGYLGWPTAMRFSALGYAVTVVDNYLRRSLCRDLGLDFLYPVPHLHERTRIWRELTGREIRFCIADLSNPENLRALFTPQGYASLCRAPWPGSPHSILHYAEQPSAPFSHLDYRTSDLTVTNNLRVTNNLLCAVRDLQPQAHIIHIGTMGEYGTPNIDIEEGWLDVRHKGREDRLLFPRQAGSIYHTTKIMDTDLMWFFVRTWELRITDLMQGPVYGIETAESRKDCRLRPYFNYDDIFGTVINRFIVQAVAGHSLTVYGKGGQTRGYININDTLQCVCKSFELPAKPGELRIFNQITETFSVVELAERIKEAGRKRGLDILIEHMENPRKEAEEHYYNPVFQALQRMGVSPHPLDDHLLQEQFELVEYYKKNIDHKIIVRGQGRQCV